MFVCCQGGYVQPIIDRLFVGEPAASAIICWRDFSGLTDCLTLVSRLPLRMYHSSLNDCPARLMLPLPLTRLKDAFGSTSGSLNQHTALRYHFVV